MPGSETWTEPASVWTPVLQAVPNGLSLLRLGLGLAFPLFPAEWRVWVVIVAALTDLMDGAASRSLSAESATGQVLDPVADKIFMLMLGLTLLLEGTLRPAEALLVGLRDLVVAAGAAWFLLKREWSAFRHMRPTFLGKAATTAQFVFLLYLVIHHETALWITAPTAILSGLAAISTGLAFLHSRRQPLQAE